MLFLCLTFTSRIKSNALYDVTPTHDLPPHPAYALHAHTVKYFGYPSRLYAGAHLSVFAQARAFV